jgi:hypothetical protein
MKHGASKTLMNFPKCPHSGERSLKLLPVAHPHPNTKCTMIYFFRFGLLRRTSLALCSSTIRFFVALQQQMGHWAKS